VPRPQRGSSASHGFFRKDEFRYDTERDAYTCPGSHELKPFRFGKLRDMTKIDYANKEACGDCPLRPRCTDAAIAPFRVWSTRARSTAWPLA
jgi:hypothetical protein